MDHRLRRTPFPQSSPPRPRPPARRPSHSSSLADPRQLGIPSHCLRASPVPHRAASRGMGIDPVSSRDYRHETGRWDTAGSRREGSVTKIVDRRQQAVRLAGVSAAHACARERTRCWRDARNMRRPGRCPSPTERCLAACQEHIASKFPLPLWGIQPVRWCAGFLSDSTRPLEYNKRPIFSPASG
jgi:hypothetical protein